MCKRGSHLNDAIKSEVKIEESARYDLMDIKLERLDGLNCVEYLIKGVSQYYNTDFELMFLGAWGFDFEVFEQRVEIKENSTNRWMLLQKYHGLKIQPYTLNDFEKLLQFVEQSLVNADPVLLGVDLFWIPWAVSDYQKEHWSHSILITSKNNNSVGCYDFFSSNVMNLSFDNLQECFGNAAVFVKTEKNLYTRNEYIADLLQYLNENFVDNNAGQKIHNLSNYIAKISTFSKESLSAFQKSSFMDTINRLAQCRYQFAHALWYLEQKHYIQFSDYIQRSKQCAINWKSVWGMLQKAFLLDFPDKLLQRICDKIHMIANQETQLINELVTYLSLLDQKQMRSIPENEKCGNYIFLRQKPINIAKYLNHKACGNLRDPKGAVFQEGFINLDANLASGVIKVEQVTYNLSIKNNLNDNITCLGQLINVQCNCSAIAIMACSEFGHQNDRMLVIDDKGTEEMKLGVSVWDAYPPAFGEQIAWEGNEGVVCFGENRLHNLKRYIFSKVYPFAEKKFLEGIVLPYCPNIHIFAITCLL